MDVLAGKVPGFDPVEIVTGVWEACLEDDEYARCMARCRSCLRSTRRRTSDARWPGPASSGESALGQTWRCDRQYTRLATTLRAPRVRYSSQSRRFR